VSIADRKVETMRDCLVSRIQSARLVGWPDRIAEFVLAHGREFRPDGSTFKGRRRTAKQCYCNCTGMVFDDRINGDDRLVYVEGFVSPYLTQHAWIMRPDGSIIDPTLRDDKPCRLYFGVPFSTLYLARTVRRNRVFGLLSPMHTTFFDLIEGRETEWRCR
jgi:hypothetical protein